MYTRKILLNHTTPRLTPSLSFMTLVFLFTNMTLVISKDKKIDFFGRFFGEKSVFGGGGKDFRVEKSSAKKSEKNRQKSPIFRKKSDIFPKKSDFSRKNPIFPDICVNCILGH